MTLQRWNDPFASLLSLHSQLDDMFNNFGGPTTAASPSVPAMDVYADSDNKHLVAEVHIPGFDKDDLEVNVHNGVLEIKGEKHEKTEDKSKKRNYMMRESHASFYRSIALPKTADDTKVNAECNNGILKVTIPLKELPAPKKITITAAKGKK